MSSDPQETTRSELNAIEEVFEYYHDSGDELNTDEEEDGNFYDGYLDQKNPSRSLTPSPSIQDEEFHEDSEEYVDALPTPTQLEDRLHLLQARKRSRSSTVTLKDIYGHQPGNNDNLNGGPESDDEDAQSQSSGSSDWEL